MIFRRPIPAVAAALLITLGAAGCSDDSTTPAAPAPPVSSSPTPTTSPPVASSAPASPTPTSVATVSLPEPTYVPEGTFNEDDAIGFAVHYLNVLNYARATGDPSLLRSISEPECQTCETLAAWVDEQRRLGYTSVDNDVWFESAELTYSDPGTQEADVNLRLITKDSRVLRPDGSVVVENSASITDGLVQMHLRDGRWYIQELPAR